MNPNNIRIRIRSRKHYSLTSELGVVHLGLVQMGVDQYEVKLHFVVKFCKSASEYVAKKCVMS